MIKIYRYDITTKEFIQELEINEAYGTNLPFTATVKPLAKKDSFVVVFNDDKWEYVEDNRNKTVYNKETKQESQIDYLGKIKEDVTTLKPEQFDKWDYDNNVWMIDLVAKDKYELEIKRVEAQQYLAKTDHKFYNGYKPKDGEDLVEIERLRDEAREFIRANEGGK